MTEKIIKIFTNVKSAIPLAAISILLTFFTIKLLIDNNLIKSNYLIISVLVFLGIIIVCGFLLAFFVTNKKSSSIKNMGDKNNITQTNQKPGTIDNTGDENTINQG